MKRFAPATASGSQSKSFSGGATNRIARRMVSAPYGSITLEGGTTLPLDLDMVSPCSSLTMPWQSRLVKGSSSSIMPMSRRTLVQKRE